MAPEHQSLPSEMTPEHQTLLTDMASDNPSLPPDMTPEHTSLPSDMIQEHSSVPYEMLHERNSSPGGTSSEPILHKKRKLKGDRSNWARTKLKHQREFGEAYISADGKEHSQRSMGNPCKQACKGTGCNIIGEADRKIIFHKVWNLSWDNKRVYIKGLVDLLPTKRKRKDIENSRRMWTLKYHLRQNDDRIRVCSTMFTNTLGLTHWFVQNAVQTHLSNKTPKSRRAPKQSHSNSLDGKKYLIKEYFEKIPKMPSHYCMKSTSKLYVEKRFQSLAEMHRDYKELCNKIMSML